MDAMSREPRASALQYLSSGMMVLAPLSPHQLGALR